MLAKTFGSFGLELAYFSGISRVLERRTGGAGAILKFSNVVARHNGGFQPLRSQQITARFLDRTLRALKRWKYDLVSIEEVPERAMLADAPRRFVALTFDPASANFMTHAYPVLQRHGVPFNVYVPTGFSDGIGQAWWLALREVVAGHSRIVTMMNSQQRRFAADTLKDKYEVYQCLAEWMQTLPPSALDIAIADLCARYDVDLKKLSKDQAISWNDIALLAADPNATLASCTVNYPILSNTESTAALREMKMGRATLEAAIGRPCLHFAYPFGDESSLGPRDLLLAAEAGFSTAVTTRAGVVPLVGKADPMALPRIDWDGNRRSLRAMRVTLSGLTLPRYVPAYTSASTTAP